MRVFTQRIHLLSAGTIGICFLLTSTAYLAWTYHIMDLAQAPLSDAVTLIVGYLFQAAGAGLFSLMMRHREDLAKASVYAALGLHMLFLAPSVLSGSFVQAAAFGCAMNLFCGWIAGYYLYRLTCGAAASRSAMTLGVGYSAAIVMSWILSVIKGGAVYYSGRILIICLIFTIFAVLVIRADEKQKDEEKEGANLSGNISIPKETDFRKFLLLAGTLVLVFSIVNSGGFGFPSGDVENGISVEFSRLFYAAGLLLAGLVNDRNRRHGAICAVIALVIPFLMLAIRGEPVSMMIFWMLSYFTFGFYSIYRMILFSDIARGGGGKSLLSLCGFGLLLGRIGDAIGEAFCLMLSGHFLALIVMTAVLFMAAILLFFRVYQYLYQPEAKRQRSEREIFNHFSARHDLSAREREVLRFLLAEKTNQEIAEELSISEGTVKYHIHNLLQKTSCRNRLELLSAFAAEQDI